MSPKFHSSHAYIAFDRLVRRCEACMLHVAPESLGYTARALSNRLIQEIVRIGLTGYVRKFSNGTCVACNAPTEPQIYSFAGLSIKADSGRVRLSPRLLLRSLIVFFLQWFHVAGVAILAFVRNDMIQKGKATLLFGIGNESLFSNGSDERFVDFCRQGPVPVLTEASRLIIQATSNHASIDPAHFEYSRFPLLALLLENPPDSKEFMQFSLQHLYALGAYLLAIFRCPPICLLGRDFAYHALVEYLDRRNLIACIAITNSNYSEQPLWMTDLPNRHFRTHMIWYSQNTIPIVYAADGVKADLPNYRHMRVDESWVWTEAYANYLRSLAIPGKIHVVGPILWHLPVGANAERKVPDEVVFAVFDATPVKDEIAERMGFFGNYYSTSNMQAFLHGVMHVRDELEQSMGKPVRVMLKHKRAYNLGHDPAYISLVERLHSEGNIELVPYDENIYSLISRADMVIVVPYSSPTYVAHILGIPSVFFDPIREVLPTYDGADDIFFASGQDELSQIIYKHIASAPSGLETM